MANVRTALRSPEPRVQAAAVPEVWRIERGADFETYSNGLRVEGLFATSYKPRSYAAFRRAGAGERGWVWRSDPAGIVFHTTESHLVDFQARRSGALKTASLGMLGYVRSQRSYHFVIDRFARVHRVVAETDAADHAGWSVWADDEWVYLNLNHSFLAVAFEAKYRAGGGRPSVSPAQIRAGRALTEMLRASYRIPAQNCVAHAQVSVNPANHRIGYHTDWEAHLPFSELGLPDNYAPPLPGVRLFGFGFDPSLAQSGEPGLWQGLLAAEDQLRRDAAVRELPPERYRAILKQQYRQLLAEFEDISKGKGNRP